MTSGNPASASADPSPDALVLRMIGNRIRRLRSEKGLARKVLSGLAGVSERHLAQLETGKGNISVILLSRLARALDTELDRLFRPENNNDSIDEILLNDLIRQLSPVDRQKAVRILLEEFVVNDRRSQRLALIGLRGAGKTTLGKQLAKEYGLPFVQLVSEIERIAGMNVSEIFSLSGQSYYRRLEERALIETLKRYDKCVIETGGSIVTEQNLLDILLKSCRVVWLSARPEDHMQRVIDQGDLRPIENNEDAMSDLRNLVQQRNRYYQQAHAHIDTSGKTVAECLQEVKKVFPC